MYISINIWREWGCICSWVARGLGNSFNECCIIHLSSICLVKITTDENNAQCKQLMRVTDCLVNNEQHLLCSDEVELVASARLSTTASAHFCTQNPVNNSQHVSYQLPTFLQLNNNNNNEAFIRKSWQSQLCTIS